MPSNKRARKREGRQARQAALLAAQRARKRKRSIVAAVLVAMLVLSVASLLNRGDGDDTDLTAGATTTVPTTLAGTTPPQGTPTTVAPQPPPSVAGGAPACPKADGTSPRSITFAAPPPMCIDPARTYTADVVTTKGAFTVMLDPKRAPKTVNNFVFLARYHYFDGVTFHRIIPGFVVQGGDPQGTGTGGPGYTFEDELPGPGQYKVGSLAMANSGKNTNGSQFFVITGDQGAALDPNYSLFGQVTSGMEVVKALEAVGTPEGKPKETVAMQSVTIKES